jgi:pimeloyl-ACP methyl ester carboxylesterase
MDHKIASFKTKKLLSVPLRSVLSLSLAPFVYFRNHQSEVLKRALQINTDTGIQSMEAVQLGGVDQWILIRGQHVNNPLLLVLHGGPGLPLMPFHTINASLEEHFTVIHWDQRGSGKSYSPSIDPASMTLDQLLSDTEELVQYLLKRFHREKLYLMGYSCGSVLGLTTVSRHPELFEAYIGVGQIVNMPESEAISYNFVMEHALKSQNIIAIKELELIGAPPYKNHRSMLEERMWVNTFGGFFYNGAKNLTFYKTGFMSPDYSLTDIRKLFKGMDFTAKHLWQAFYQTNFFETIHQIDVPVHFIAGRHDYVVPQTVLEHYFNQLSAPQGKSLTWFEESAHWPFLEEPEAFHETLVNFHRELIGEVAYGPEYWKL